MGEHVVLFDRHASKYPYSEGGEFPLPATIDWLDPFVALELRCRRHATIRLATGICLVPSTSRSSLAKQAASLDRLSGGRFTLGVGASAGWSRSSRPWACRSPAARSGCASISP